MADEINTPVDPDQSPSDDPILQEAKDRFARATEWESTARTRFINDYKFAEGDADNHYQWPNVIRRDREIEAKPTLTINQTRQHNLQIINEAKQNKPGIKVRARGNGATKESSDVFGDIVRYIEYRSNAQACYDLATSFMVKGGWGAWRVLTEYVDDESFDQEILIQAINDPLTVYIDPDCVQPDKSDAKWGFVFDKLPLDEARREYPDLDLSQNVLAAATDDWVTKDHVRRADYYRRVKIKDELLSYVTEEGVRETVLKSKMPKEAYKTLKELPESMTREVERNQVFWYKIVGTEIVDQGEWAGSYIPLIIIVGEETIIEGRLDRKGHTRALKDPQRIYNYWSSSAVEHVALQGKTPWIAPAKAIEGFENYWNTANKINHAVLPYNNWDDDGQTQIPAPQKDQPPQMAQAYIQGMQISRSELMFTSGQYEAATGQEGNERTGRAINERQRKGDTATYHYIDALALGVRYTGKIILDLIPHIYDTERVISIMAVDGEDYEIKINPQAQQAFQQKQEYDGTVAERIFNPTVGRYDVEIDVGPAYATRREEAWNAYSLILTQNPGLTGLLGDLLFRAADFPMAEEAAQRLKRVVPAEALGEGPSQEVQQLQAQLQNTQNALAALLSDNAEKDAELRDKDRLRDIGTYEAETGRIKVLLEGLLKNDEWMKKLTQDLVRESAKTQITKDAEPDQGGTPPPPNIMEAPEVPGAVLGANGLWHTPSHTQATIHPNLGQGPSQLPLPLRLPPGGLGR